MSHISASRTFAWAKEAGLLSGTSYPWTWILSPKGEHITYQGNFDFIINPTLWILIIPSTVYMLYEFIRSKNGVSLFVLLWFGATYLVWIPVVLLTDRITLIYYFYPAIGPVCIAASLAIERMWQFAAKRRSVLYRRLIKGAVIGYLVTTVLIFLVFTPILAALASYTGASNVIR
jgi:dolichyl-phosphate-mannose--protein O-mannosyl transferase